jgi:hypothetical protein
MAKANELDWEEYESITRFIFENVGAKSGIKIKGFGRNFWVTGKSGEKHQVDVLTEQITGDQKLQTAIECKFIKKKVTKEIVMKLHAVMDDAGIDSGIIVCKAGYTKSTMNYAAHKGIKLIELREAGEEDLKEHRVIDAGTLDININAALTRPIITEIDLGTKTITDQNEIMGMYRTTMFNADGKEVYFKTCLFEFGNDLEQYNVLMRMTRNSYTPSGGRLTWNNNGEELVVTEIKITGYLTRTDSSSKKSFQIVDEVWLIMDEIFEKRRSALAKSGLMYNLPRSF